jgi:hypothetical protein
MNFARASMVLVRIQPPNLEVARSSGSLRIFQPPKLAGIYCRWLSEGGL